MDDHVGKAAWASFLLPFFSGLTAVEGALIAAVALLALLLSVLLFFLFKGRQTKSKTFGGQLEEKSNELAIANDKYNFLLSGTGFGVFEIYDLKDFSKPIFWSARMFELLGFQVGAFVPTIQAFLSFVHPEDRKTVQDSLFESLQRPSGFLEYRLRVGDEFRWFQARTVAKIAESGKVLFIIGTVEDIDHQKTAEEKIRSMNILLEEEVRRRTHQLELANKAKTRFIANVSHEIRTPLGVVLGFSETLESNKSLDKEAKEYVHLIRKNGEILSTVINDLLDLTKIEAGKLSFHFSRVKLQDLMGDLETAFREKALQKGLQIYFQNFCPHSETVVTDVIRLKQVIYNVLANAVKFTDRGSIRVELGARDKHYFIDVIDTGIGIPDKEKIHIFDEFAHSEMAESSHGAGSGLGLRLASNLARALGGNVELVSSQVEKGSHFRITFQSDEGRLQTQVERRHEAAFATKLNDFEVFVLDDNEDNIRLAEIFLKKLGCRVRGFTSAKSLFAEMVSADPDLILLDINMPEMNGFEVFDRLRQLGYKNPIWALTAYSLNEDIQAILNHGFDDLIRKPMSGDSMRRKLMFELRERSND